MVISTKHKFIFIHIPKNAGSSLTNALEQYVFDEDLDHFSRSKHTKHQTLKEILNTRNRLSFLEKFYPKNYLRNYFKFAVVRNPYDRMVSLYHYLKRSNIRKEVDSVSSFDEFIHLIEQPGSWVNTLYSLKLQSEYILDSKGNNVMNYICKYESLVEDLKCVEQELGIKIEMPHKNKSEHKSYKDYYTAELSSIVLRHFEKDFELFSYSKELDK